MPEDWRDRCTRVGLGSCPERGIDKPDYIYFAYDCSCVGYKQVATLRRRPQVALACPEHGDSKKQPSALLLAVRAQLQHACPELGPIVLEAHLLRRMQHPFDMWFPKWQIAADVDGRQHFVDSMHGKAAKAQYQHDRKVDAACKRERLRLLRFHYADDKQWGSLMQWAVKAVKENPHCWFHSGTGSYDFEADRQAAALTK